jgi:hypothetical protein
MLQDVPAWASRLLLYVVIGIATLFAIPVMAWMGKREIQRWEEKVSELESEIDRMQRNRRQEHQEVGKKLDRLLERIES